MRAAKGMGYREIFSAHTVVGPSHSKDTRLQKTHPCEGRSCTVPEEGLMAMKMPPFPDNVLLHNINGTDTR